MLLKVLVLASVLIASSNALVPSYVKVCGRRNPNLDKCILESVMAMKDKLLEGIPELDVPSIDPFKIDVVKIADMPSFKGNAINVTVSGLSNFEVTFMHVDLEKQVIDIEATFKEVKLQGSYDITARILVPIVGTGPLTIVGKNLKSTSRHWYKLVERKGKTYVYFNSMTEHLDIQDYDAQMGLDSGNMALQEAINQVLGNSHKEVIEASRPTLEKHIASNILTLSNNICKHFTYDELYPDRE